MPHLEPIPTHRSVILLIVVFALLYLPNLATRELRLSEALFGTVAAEMVGGESIWHTTVHGDPVERYPFYSWLVAACRQLGADSEWAVRLPAAGSVALLALISGIFAYTCGGPLAGIIAAAMVLCNVACLRVGRRAQSETVLACLLAAAWMTWYLVGQRRKRWTLAWIGALAFVLPAAFTAGARAVAIFYLPFFFLRRPVKGRRRLTLGSHLVPLALFIGALLTWFHHVPGQAFFPWNELRAIPGVSLSYPVDLLLFPVKCAIYLFPWTFLAWTPLCMAYRGLERSPVTFHYLRTIVLSITVTAWLMPHVSPLALLPVLSPLAVMTGLHAEIMLRRHVTHLRLLPVAMALAAAVVAMGGLAVAGVHAAGVVDFQRLPIATVYANAVLLAVAAATAAVVLRGPLRRQPFRVRLVVSFAALGLALVSLHDPWVAWSGNERKEAGLVLAGEQPPPNYLLPEGSAVQTAVPPPESDQAAAAGSTGQEPASPPALPLGETPPPGAAYRPIDASVVFQTTRSYYVVQCFYMGQPVRRIKDPRAEIPLPVPVDRANSPQWTSNLLLEATSENAASPPYVDAVYALSTNGPPILPEVKWQPLTPALNLRRRKVVRATWFPGGLCLVRLRTQQDESPEDEAQELVRMYRGVRR